MMKDWLRSQARHPYFSLLVLCACLASPLITQGNLIPGMIVLLGYAAIIASPLFFHVSTEKWILILVFLLSLLDIPASRPYYEHLALTEMLGSILFDPIKQVTGIPIPFTFFEFFSYFLVVWLFFRNGLLSSSGFQVALLVGSGIPCAAWLSAGLGTLRGNSLFTAYTQIRFISVMVAWSVIGFYLTNRTRYIWRALQLILLAVLLKSLYALAVFLFIFGGTLGKREYLIDHLSSLIMATGLFFIFGNLFFRRVNRVRIVPWLLATLIIGLPYIINDRRASFFGVAMAACFLPLVVSRTILKRIFWPMVMATPLLIPVLAYKVLKGGSDSSSLAGIVTHVLAKGGQQLDYREIENFNLYFSVINNPLIGLGFGRSFPIIMPMPDISFVFKIFDLIPHNTVLYIWAFTGPLGMAALGVAIMIPLIASIRLIKFSQNSETVVIAFVAYTFIIGWFCFAYFDMGILDSRAQALFGFFLGSILNFYQSNVETLRSRNV